jgi:hypothetical protein
MTPKYYPYALLVVLALLLGISYYTVRNHLLLTQLLTENGIEKPALVNPVFDESKHSLRAVAGTNFAPHLETFPATCKDSVLWGREHHGGWYICKDYLPKNEKCIIYSFGLGKCPFS